MQHSNFADDVARLQDIVDGTQIEFGDKDSHYTELFHLERRYQPSANDRTYELLMYSIDDASSRYFSQEGLTTAGIRQKLRFDSY